MERVSELACRSVLVESGSLAQRKVHPRGPEESRERGNAWVAGSPFVGVDDRPAHARPAGKFGLGEPGISAGEVQEALCGSAHAPDVSESANARLVPEVAEIQGNPEVVALHGLDRLLEVVAFLAVHPELVALDLVVDSLEAQVL